nr:integrase, catalytic region, zinc finger, CCHC-type, peptidase aspartic, catalytic [Tanacetum cinerariifolium]
MSTNTKFAKKSFLGKPPKLGETHALSKPVTSNLNPTPQESKVMKNHKVIAPGMFRINPFKASGEEKHVPNKVRASVRTKPITISQPPANVSINEKQKKQQLKVKKIKKVGFIERLASPKSSKPRSFLRWSPTERLFDLKGKIIAFSESESLSDCSKGDNACTYNPLEHTIKWFPNSIFLWHVIQLCLWCVDSGCSKHMTENLKLLINFVWKFLGTVRFRNDHVAAILGFGDLQWGNILITRVYFVEGLGHNLFSVGQFCDSDFEVAFRRNACFAKNLEGVDLLSGNRTTNLYTINLHDIAFASPICPMARASSTKSCLWHQRLSHLNFDIINDLVKNDLVSGLPKFKYHKEHLCLSCKQEKSKRASYPPKPVPNSKQRLHLLHMDLCGPIRIASINQKRKPDISFLRVFGDLCYPKNDREDIGKLGAKGDIGFFIGYSADSCAYRIYNRRTKKIMETMNVSFDELLGMAFEQRTTQQPSEGELDLLFEAMYDDYIGSQPSIGQRSVMAAQVHQVRQRSTTSTSIADIAPTPTNSSSQATNFLISSQDVDGLNLQQQQAQQQGNQASLQPKTIADNVSNAMFDENTFVSPFATSSISVAESSSS